VQVERGSNTYYIVMILCYLLLRNTVNNITAAVAVAVLTLDLSTSVEKCDDIWWIRTSN